MHTVTRLGTSRELIQFAVQWVILRCRDTAQTYPFPPFDPSAVLAYPPEDWNTRFAALGN